jgi:hypothetical protein
LRWKRGEKEERVIKGYERILIGLDIWGRVQGDFSLSENLGVQVVDISS